MGSIARDFIAAAETVPSTSALLAPLRLLVPVWCRHSMLAIAL
jgi:hypothetical protein